METKSFGVPAINQPVNSVLSDKMMRIHEEKRKVEAAAVETDKLRLQRAEERRLAQEKLVESERESRRRESEWFYQRKLLQEEQMKSRAEQEKQRLVVEQTQRELARQQRLEATSVSINGS